MRIYATKLHMYFSVQSFVLLSISTNMYMYIYLSWTHWLISKGLFTWREGAPASKATRLTELSRED